MSAPLVSVVLVTHDQRPEVLRRLVRQLTGQVMTANAFEVIVVDDGSGHDAAAQLEALSHAMPIRLLRLGGIGKGAARHQGALLARGHILVFLDDDMQVPSEFLHAHLAAHLKRAESLVVLGNVQPAEPPEGLALLPRYRARQTARWQTAITAGSVPIRGTHLSIGNVSMRREDYLAIGGLDAALLHSGDRDLGLRLGHHGCHFVFGARAISYHQVAHARPEQWLTRARLSGQDDARIARRQRAAGHEGQCHRWAMVPAVTRPVFAAAMAIPPLGRLLSLASYRAAQLLDWCGSPRRAVSLAGLSHEIAYLLGARDEGDTPPGALGLSR